MDVYLRCCLLFCGVITVQCLSMNLLVVSWCRRQAQSPNDITEKIEKTRNNTYTPKKFKQTNNIFCITKRNTQSYVLSPGKCTITRKRVTNINFLLTISIHHQEKRLWELITCMITKGKMLWSFNWLLNSLNWFLKKMYRDQFGEFICGYQGLKA